MSRQYSNRSSIPPHHYVPSYNSSRQFRQPIQNDFSYFQYPPHRQPIESNREINNHRHHHRSFPLNRIATAAPTSHHHFENPSAASFTRHPPWFDDNWNDHHGSRSSHHNNHTKRQRSSTAGTLNSQSYYYQPYPNHRPAQIQPTNPTPRHVSSYPRSFENGSRNQHHFHHESPPVASSLRQSLPSFNTHRHHQNGMTFEPSPHRSPLFQRTPMTTHMHQRPPPSFLLTDLLHRVMDAHASSYSDNHVHYHHPPSASIDLIAYAWMSPSHELFSLPTTFSIQFSDFFDLAIPDETPVVGLTDTELERLPTMIYSSAKIKADDKCAICLSEYVNGEKLKRLRCKHYFHSECIDPWLKTSTRCPICRSEQTN